MAPSNALLASGVLVKHRIMVTLIFSLLVAVSEGGGACFPRCDLGSVCCMGVCVVTSCQGRYCVTTSDCSWGETCCNSKCAAESGCVGQSCTKDYQCDVGEKCCDDVCTDAQSCNCHQDPDCPIEEICCHGSCTEKSDCSANSYNNPTFLIVGTVLGSLVLISVISIFIYLFYRRRWKIPHSGSVQSVTASVTTPNSTAQSEPASRTASGNFYCPIPSSPAYNTF